RGGLPDRYAPPARRAAGAFAPWGFPVGAAAGPCLPCGGGWAAATAVPPKAIAAARGRARRIARIVVELRVDAYGASAPNVADSTRKIEAHLTGVDAARAQALAVQAMDDQSARSEERRV